ncbi:MAG: Ldh family oxidoreductase [Rhodospirillaceae bacterium]|jgi:delta1-piperideine-2-carboxylate reductase|nr:Ldh family oxidoreductase [Rhodospirillaceae bacterium]MBT5912278.1 Ldh family oxidoreductase [Rhodospirillaceae bacterium]MBT6307649.1 Ldh family oxidoreductase [Rhodospirillaceae bacterium]MDC0997704.1 Ldh family oxidoreductase [Alphaproteobacteria bacterium]MDC1441472.1 Ldh family oxidoreductase [Rhodospirillaceae bacterium]
MKLSIEDAQNLVVEVMQNYGYNKEYAQIIGNHIIDCELRGLAYGGMARIVSITERLDRTGAPERLVETVHETPVSAKLNGHDNLGYVVALKATEMAIEKASKLGISLVGANDTWYTGMLSYFSEIAAARGMVTIIASNATPWVAPHGAVDGRFGTNPVCFGFPSEGDPVIWDIGTSSIMHAEVMLARRLGQKIGDGLAFDAAGNPTQDPEAALEGAFTPWGGHKGAGLGMIVQMLGILAGSPVEPPDLASFGFLIVAMKPDLLMPEPEYRRKVSAYADYVRSARPVSGGEAVRMPFERSARVRRRRLEENKIEVNDLVYKRLNKIIN